MEDAPRESALLLACPAAEPAVGEWRRRYDRAAAAGVPAHVTIAYPFKPEPTAADHASLERLLGGIDRFVLEGRRTAWFGDEVAYVELGPAAVRRVLAVVDAVTAAFPDFPPYGGVFEELVPHLTIGHGAPRAALAAAARAVGARLPFAQPVDHVELWTGPPLDGAGPGSWQRARDYRLRPGR